MNQRDFEKAIDAEVGNWPGAAVEFVAGGKHPKAKLTHGGKQMGVTYPGTPGDAFHGVHNTLSDIRRALKKLGAVRAKPEPSKDEDEAPYKKPNDGAEKRASPRPAAQAKPETGIAEKLADAGAVTHKQGLMADAGVVTKPLAATLDQAPVRTGEAKPVDQIKAEFDARVNGIVDGIYFGLPSDVYHSVPRLSSSGIQKLCVSPATFWRGSWLDPDRPDQDEDTTIWQLLGRAYHTARLEPHLFESTYARELDKADCPEGTLFTGTEMSKALEDMGLKKSGSVAEQAERLADSGFPAEQLWPLIKAAWDKERGARAALPAKHYDQMVTDRDRISLNSQIAPLLTGGEAEVSVFWTDEYGLKMKARVDYLTRDWWADFKTFDNSRGKDLNQALADSVRYNRYYIQAPVYREAVEAVRLDGLQIIEAQTDDQRTLIAHLQMKPSELRCWYIFQEKGGIPNLLGREFPFYSVPYTTLFNEQITGDEARRAAGREATKQRTDLFRRGAMDVLNAKKQFALYCEVYKPGQPWFPINAIGSFDDSMFHPYWLSGDVN